VVLAVVCLLSLSSVKKILVRIFKVALEKKSNGHWRRAVDAKCCQAISRRANIFDVAMTFWQQGAPATRVTLPFNRKFYRFDEL
jgi:hypothetical protein